MAITLTVEHDEHFDLLLPDDAPSDVTSEGAYTVLNRDGEQEQRGKYRFSEPSNLTSVELPDDYDPSDLTALTHLVQTLRDRHSDAPTGVSGSDPKITATVAALMGVPVLHSNDEETSA